MSKKSVLITDETRKEIKELRDQGWKLADIAYRYGMSVGSVQRALKATSMEQREPAWCEWFVKEWTRVCKELRHGT